MWCTIPGVLSKSALTTREWLISPEFIITKLSNSHVLSSSICDAITRSVSYKQGRMQDFINPASVQGCPALGSMLKNRHRGPKGGGGGPDPKTSPDPHLIIML